MESSVYFKFKKLPSIEDVISKLGSSTNLNVKFKEQKPRTFSSDELIQFGLTLENARLYYEKTKGYYLRGDNIPYSNFLIFDMDKKNIEFSGINFHKKYYFEGALLLVLKKLGGEPSQDLKSLLTDYSYKIYEEAKGYEKFRE